MEDISILFLAPNWRVSLVRAFRKSLTEKVTLIGADSDSYSSALKVMDRSYVIPRFSEQRCIDKIISICEKENINTILPMTNKAIAFMDRNRDQFNKGNLLLYLADSAVIKICNDKRRLADFFIEHGIASPNLVNPNEPCVEFPLLAKEPCGEGGNNCFKLENQIDLDFYSKKLQNHIFQKFIQGREFSIDWFSDKNSIPVVAVPRERLAIRAGEVMVSRIELIPDIIESAKKLGKRLHLTGPANFQGILGGSGKFWFTDINLRFGSGVLHTIHAGADIPGMMLQELVGGSVDKKSNSMTNGSTMSRFHDALFFDV